jgi:hypothetical protein
VSPQGDPSDLPVTADPARDGEGASVVRRPVFHVFEEFYRRALHAEPRPAPPARPAVRHT